MSEIDETYERAQATSDDATNATNAATSNEPDASSAESSPHTPVDINHYAYRVRWNEESNTFVASCAELPEVTFTSDSQLEAFVGIRLAVAEEAERRQSQSEEVPEPLAERHYSGRILVRVPPELHRRLTIDAAEQQISLNRLISNRLAEL
ncbi:type II toxin-antitoxin system HicB family antitoxin [Bifidobacterium scaligerum]|uniref:Toxin-antitoxin system HicB family antitoxin n=1 Tax=Bifidobacterium scaligerum TaxID=2052656 RepID=A0A2M9HP60_9BIFI|nr:type II toxin-antitoxin system HicB family antitoxin [Bifidobacterium scaligerum]PJM78606.1 toxin-antitoxin system HicB family antitoxin [Bifidobacterium scaligerum]